MALFLQSCTQRCMLRVRTSGIQQSAQATNDSCQLIS